MVEISFTHKALEDIKDIAEYIERRSPKFARKFVSSVFEKVEILKAFPQIGRVVDEFGVTEIREIFYQQYRIVYHILNDEEIHVITVQHSSRVFRNTIQNL